MFKDTKNGKTNYCTHKNNNTSAICDECLGKVEPKETLEEKHKPMTTKQQAYQRCKEGKASKAELEILLKWACAEQKEWTLFRRLIERKLSKLS